MGGRALGALPLLVATVLGTWGCEPAATSEDPPEAVRSQARAADSVAPSPAEGLALGIDHYYAGRYDSALAVLDGAIQGARRTGDRATEADALVWQAYTHRRLGDLDQAATVGEQALTLKLQYNLPEVWRAYNALALTAWNESRNRDAEALWEEALPAAEAEGEAEAVATMRGNLGLVLNEYGRFAEARENFEAMRRYGAEAGDAHREGNALINLAMLDNELGEYGQALPRLERARILHEAGDRVFEVETVLGHLGTAYAGMGELGRAYATIDSALAMTRTHGLRGNEAHDLRFLAELHAEAGDLRHALDLLEQAAAIYEDIGWDSEYATTLQSQALRYVDLGDLETARVLVGRALEMHLEAGVRLEALNDLLLLAELAQRSGNGPEAVRHLERARRQADALGIRAARGRVAVTEARIADAEGAGDRVLAVLWAADADVRGGDYATEWEAESLRARALLRSGDLEAARLAGTRAVETAERVRESFSSGILRSSYVTSRLESYADLVTVLLRTGRTAEAFQVADAARGRGLEEHLVESGAHARGQPELASGSEDTEAVLRRIEHLRTRLEYYLNQPEPAAVQTAREVALELAQARGEYERILVRADEANAEGGTRIGRASLEDVQAALEPGEVLLEYLVSPDRLTVFAVSPDGLDVTEAPVSSENLTSRVRLARELLADPEGSELGLTMLTRLHEVLLEPVQRTGALHGAETLIVVPHEALTYLPLAALRDPETQRFVAEDRAVLYAPSAAAFATLRAADRGPGMDAHHAAGAVLAPFPEELPGTELEARTAARALGLRPVLGADADEPAMRMALEGGGIVHVASHGVMNPVNPMFSRIELGGGGADAVLGDARLEVHEVFDLSIHADLVFLSGCETGVGASWATEFIRGEDYATLAQAFLFAGARDVVASLWRIEDDSAARFAELFYEELATLRPTEALAAAQRKMIADPRFRSPFNWAAYQISGAGAQRGARLSM